MPAKIEHHHGDTDLGLTGGASVGSRSAMCAGTAIVHTADVMLAKGKKIASALLEASEADIQYRDGGFEVVGTDRKISLFDTARRAKEMGENLDTKDKAEAPLTFPNGCHIAEVEIDPDTGLLEIVTYTAVDDCGNMLDKIVVEGQVQGSIAQGPRPGADRRTRSTISASGQLVTGSFMDYGMPHAEIMPIELREAVHHGAGDHQSARRQGHRRGRHHGGDRRGDERGLERHPERRRRPHGNAGDAGEGVGSVPEGHGGSNIRLSSSAKAGDPAHADSQQLLDARHARCDAAHSFSACEMNLVFI